MQKLPAHEDHACRPWFVQDDTPQDQPLIEPSSHHAPTTEVPRQSRRERRKVATREALIIAAQDVIEEITERADVAKGSL